MSALRVNPDQDAPLVAEKGPCDRCQQPRPLFRRTEKHVEHVKHDCPDCIGHDEETTLSARLCPRCYSDATVEWFRAWRT